MPLGNKFQTVEPAGLLYYYHLFIIRNLTGTQNTKGGSTNERYKVYLVDACRLSQCHWTVDVTVV